MQRRGAVKRGVSQAGESMTDRNDRMIEFRLKGPMNNRLPNVGKSQPGERVLFRVSMILCLFPEHCEIRTVNGWTLEVYEEDFPGVERAFRGMFLGGKVHAV